MMRQTKRTLYFVLGWLFLALAMMGVFLPLLPTTPFLLLTAFCFSRSSERWHRWLINQPHLGPLILDWQFHGVIRPRAKILATSLMVPLVSLSLFFGAVPLYAKWCAGLICAAVLVFIWTRPSKKSTN
ncbi:MAG: hypothetical protein OM95_03315 [Bdellovibrio sp. ArHS]|uniref:YbaN family protein n=1 Tax=Bdellovibrio sp. ArHS TaxID=1569284 RepID=UPI000583A797|nr:YbaN family protein [Bdellovibrio sp. ArHS]KHD89412.1 MAG: hypothetical protein OM95_03315 [Bdellovibrio sp. ArHS]